MTRVRLVRGTAAGVAAAALLTVTPAGGGGFSIFEQGSKAMGMAGAFVAQADDPSALFYNVGGLPFFEQREFAAGFTLVTSTDEEFVGQPPGFATASTGTLESLREPVPHFYWIEPVSPTWNFGLAVNSPFGLKTEWENPDEFTGRFINTKAELLVVDINPNIGVKVSDTFGIGFGPIVRLSEVELNRRQAVNDPFTGGLTEFAATRLQSDMDEGFGWQIGLLHRYSDRFSWGLVYRSELTVDYEGDARSTQISTGNQSFDQLLAATFPFDRPLPVRTAIDFPDSASLGLAFALGARSLLELDINWAGWSNFRELVIEFPENPAFDSRRPEEWRDSYTYRIGLLLGRGSDTEWRFGYVWDESPQPTQAVSPLLPDLDRAGYSAGWGRKGDRVDLDLALMYLDFDPRTNDVSIDDFNGTYSQTGWLLMATVAF